MHSIEDADLQYMNNYYAKFKYIEMKTVGVTYYTNLKPPHHFGWKKMSKFSTRKNIKYLSNVHKMEGAHIQCVNNHYAKFEYKGMITVGVTDYTNQTPPTHFG